MVVQFVAIDELHPVNNLVSEADNMRDLVTMRPRQASISWRVERHCAT